MKIVNRTPSHDQATHAEQAEATAPFSVANMALAQAVQQWNRGEDPRKALDQAFEAAGQAPGWPGPKLQEGIRAIAEAYGFVIGESNPRLRQEAAARPIGLRQQGFQIPDEWVAQGSTAGHRAFVRDEGWARFTIVTAATETLSDIQPAFLTVTIDGQGAPIAPDAGYGPEFAGKPLHYQDPLSVCFKAAERALDLCLTNSTPQALADQLLNEGWVPEGIVTDFCLTKGERDLLLEINKRFKRDAFRLCEMPPTTPYRQLEQGLQALAQKGLVAPMGSAKTADKALWVLTPQGAACARSEWQFRPDGGWQHWHTGGGCTAFGLLLPSRWEDAPWTLMLTSEEGANAPSSSQEPSRLGVYDQDGQNPIEPQVIFKGTAEEAAREGVALQRLIEEAAGGGGSLDDAALLALLRETLPKRGWVEASL